MARDIVMKPPTSGPRLGRLSPLVQAKLQPYRKGTTAVPIA